MKCPSCGAELVVLKKPAPLYPTPDLLDLLPEDVEVPMDYLIAVCPECGFVITASDVEFVTRPTPPGGREPGAREAGEEP